MLTNLFDEKINGSIDIGSRNIRGLILNNKKINKVVKKAILKDSSEAEFSKDSIEAGIREVIEELNLSKKMISISLPGQNFSLKQLFIKKVEDEKKRKEIIGDELIDMVPGYDPVDYITATITLRSNEENEELIAISIEREKIEYYQNFFSRFKIKLMSIYPDFISIYNLIEKKRDYDFDQKFKGVTAAIDIGLESTKILFLDDDGILSYESIFIGGENFTNIIQNYKGVSYIEAEDQKKSMEIGDETQDETQDMLMFSELTNTYSELENEIALKIERFRSKYSNHTLKKIILLGEGSLLKGFLHKIHEKEKIDTEYADFSELNINIELKELEDVEIVSLIGNVIDEVI